MEGVTPATSSQQSPAPLEGPVTQPEAPGPDPNSGPQRSVTLGVRLEKPPKYGGKRDRDACKLWLSRMRMHLWNEQTFGGTEYNDGQKIAIASSFLEKEALHWHMMKFLPGVPTGLPQSVNSFEEWATVLQNRFQDVRAQQTRRDEWDSLIQVGTAANFAQKIESDASHLTPTPTADDMLLLFKRGLKPEIRARIEALPDDFLPKSFHSYVEFADKQERELQANKRSISFRRDSKRTGSKSSQGQGQGNRQNPPNAETTEMETDGDTPMTGLDSIRAEHSQEEKDEWTRDCRDRNACFKCGKEGHKAYACKSKKKSGKGRSR
jgi:hypothetical protein